MAASFNWFQERLSTPGSPRRLSSKAPTSVEQTIKCVMKHHKKAVESLKINHQQVIEHANQTTKNILEKDHELRQAKMRMQKDEQQIKELDALLQKTNAENDELRSSSAAQLKKYAMLENEYDKKSNNANAALSKLNTELEMERKAIEELAAAFAVKTEAWDSEKAQLDEARNQLEAQNEYLVELLENNRLELVQRMTAEAQLSEVNLARLQSELAQKDAEHAQQRQRAELSADELLKTLTELKIALGEMEMEQQQMRQEKQQLMDELAASKERYEQQLAELKAQEEQERQIQAGMATQLEQLQDRVRELEEMLERSVRIKGQQDELEIRLAEILTLNEEMQQASRAQEQQFESERQFLIEQHEQRLGELQAQLEHREAELVAKQQQHVELEREKNLTIAELKYKINKIGNVFKQNVRSTSAIVPNVTPPPPPPAAVVEILSETEELGPSPSIAAHFTPPLPDVSPVHLVARQVRKTQQRPVYLVNPNNSDFASESDSEQPLIRFKKKSGVKRGNQVNKSDSSDIFDQLKRQKK